MCHSVIVQIRRSGETFTTKLTNMRLLTSMDPSVCIQTAARTETFLAEITDIRSLASMNPHMAF